MLMFLLLVLSTSQLFPIGFTSGCEINFVSVSNICSSVDTNMVLNHYGKRTNHMLYKTKMFHVMESPKNWVDVICIENNEKCCLGCCKLMNDGTKQIYYKFQTKQTPNDRAAVFKSRECFNPTEDLKNDGCELIY